MRISRIDATPLAIPLEQEFHWAGGAQRGADLVLCAVHTEEGVVGYGESVCESPLAVAEVGRLIARQVVGRSVGDVEAILHSIWTEGRWKTTPQFTGFVVSGIETACWDARRPRPTTRRARGLLREGRPPARRRRDRCGGA